MKKIRPIQEKRQSVRFPVFSLVKYAIEPEPDVFRTANIRNISCGGLAFFTEQRIAKGTVLRLCFLLSSRARPVEVRGKAMWCRQSTGNGKAFEIGVQFLDVPPDARFVIQNLEGRFLKRHPEARLGGSSLPFIDVT